MFTVHTTPEEFENGDFTLKTHYMFPVHTTLEEVENGCFTLKTHHMFPVHTTLEEVENGCFTLKTHQMFFVHTTPTTWSPVFLGRGRWDFRFCRFGRNFCVGFSVVALKNCGFRFRCEPCAVCGFSPFSDFANNNVGYFLHFYVQCLLRILWFCKGS